MATIKDIINIEGRNATQIISDLKQKSVTVPAWGGVNGLEREFDPSLHPVMDKATYPDVVDDKGQVEKVTRVTYDWQRLATRRMSELVCGIPVRRVYKPENDRQQEIARYLEKIYERNRIDSVNTERLNMLFAGCEIMTLWYAVEQPNNQYGFKSNIKLRCRTFSPMLGDELYPLFDEYGDMIAGSIGYRRKVGRKTMQFFDAYTDDAHYKWSGGKGEYTLDEDEKTTIGKIPLIYAYRPTPIWEDTSRLVYELEWAMSRNGNYLRKNSKPLFIVFANEQIRYGDEQDQDKEFRSVMQYPQGSSAGYYTWAQAIDNLKFYVNELRQSFFTQLQLPDWSYEKMSQQALSGESRKQLFIDAQLKTRDESGRLLEFFDRETNVIKAFLKVMLDDSYADDIDALPVEHVITPFTITDSKERVELLTAANGNKPLMSQRESIEEFGHSTDVDKTLQEIVQENELDSFSLTQ